VKVKYLVLILAALAQIAAVGWMIGKREHILAKGTPVKFVAEPCDPEDPFSGRYIALNLNAPFKVGNDPVRTIDLWASLELDEQGYAKVVALAKEKPVGHLCLHVDRIQLLPDPRIPDEPPAKDQEDPPDAFYNCIFPFDRYYMNEKAAPDAEERYRQTTRAASGKDNTAHRRDTYLVVRVLDGEGVAEELYVDGRPVEQLLSEKR
jgi:hypothetical protein